MKERVEKLLNMKSDGLWISTFHSSCVRILRRNIEKLGFDRNFVIFDTSDQKTALEIPYRQAYEMAIRGVSAGTSGDDDDLAQTNGRTAARQSIFDALMTGKAITSTTKQTYPMYWGEDWDKHNDAS